MNSMVKNVFLVILGVTVAVILYLVLFGTTSLKGESLVGKSVGNVESVAEWEGALWHLARAVETPIARYYYEYCYLPNIHQNDYVDQALGGSPKVGDIQKTETDLTRNFTKPYDDTHDFQDEYEGVYHYSTGWF